MKSAIHLFAALVFCFAASCWANDDIYRDNIVETVSRIKRSCITSTNTGGLSGLADKFTHTWGKRAVNCGPTGSTWGGSCDYTKPIIGTGGIWNGPILGKRDTEDPFRNKVNHDIIFVLDTSGSIPGAQFEIAKEALATLTESFCPLKLGHGLGEKQVSVVLFADKVEVAIPFGASADTVGQLQDKIAGIKHRRGGATATPAALKYVRENLLGQGKSRLGDSSTATHVVVVTDGQCNRDCSTLKEEAEAVRKMGVQLFAMGVANARACELGIITGKGGNLSYGLSDFKQLKDFAKAVHTKAQELPSKCV